MLQRAATNGREISKEDFYNIMTKKTIWIWCFDWIINLQKILKFTFILMLDYNELDS
jgi:hypothetical protein